MSCGNQKPFPTFLHIYFVFMSIPAPSSLLLFNYFYLWKVTHCPSYVAFILYCTYIKLRYFVWLPHPLYPPKKAKLSKNKTWHMRIFFFGQPILIKGDCRGRRKKYFSNTNNFTGTLNISIFKSPSIIHL